MSFPELGLVGAAGAVGGVLVATGVIGPDAMFSDAGYAMLGIVASSLIGATATIVVTLITVTAQRRTNDDREQRLRDDGDGDRPTPPTQIRRKRNR